MDKIFRKKDYEIDVSSDTLVITTPDGREVDMQISGLADVPLDSSIDSEHTYINDSYIGPKSLYPDKEALFKNIRERTAPQFIHFGTDERVTNGSQTSIPVIGTVDHWVDGDDYMAVNVTVQDEHWLDPGVVVRWLDEREDGYHLMTFGLGNGALGELNKISSPLLWHPNAYLIAGEDLKEGYLPFMGNDNEIREHETPAYKLAELFTGKAGGEYVVDPHWAKTAPEPETPADYFGFVGKDDVPAIEEQPDAAIQWAYGELLATDETLILSGDPRTDVESLYEAAGDDPAMQLYLEHIDYQLAGNEAASGVESVKPVIGQIPDIPSTLSADDALLNPMGNQVPSVISNLGGGGR